MGILLLIGIVILYLYCKPRMYDIEDGFVLDYNWQGERRELIFKW